MVAAVVGFAGCASSGMEWSAAPGTAIPTAPSASSGASGRADDGAIPAAPAGTGSADHGDLHIRGAYIPQQASDSEAAAYFSVTNSGGTADTLLSVTSPAAPAISLHSTTSRGGADTMVMRSDLAIPARRTTALTVGHDHLMLMNPVQRLTQGQHVALTLTFAHAGKIDLDTPVVGFTGPDRATATTTAGASATSPGMDGTGGMAGMTMPMSH